MYLSQLPKGEHLVLLFLVLHNLKKSGKSRMSLSEESVLIAVRLADALHTRPVTYQGATPTIIIQQVVALLAE